MNPRFASAFGMVALIGLLLHLAPPFSGAPQAASAPTEPAADASSSTSSDSSTSADTAESTVSHDGPATAVCRYFGRKTSNSYPQIDEQAEDNAGIERLFCLPQTDRPKISFMIATVPDPAATRLGYFTDRSVESIFRAAQAARWDFVAQWLPWMRGKSDDDRKTWIESDAKYPEPGVLIFRKSAEHGAFPPELLFVFVAGETPTGGIEFAEIRKALHYGWALSGDYKTPGDQKTINISGPTFSGSLHSLHRAITEFHKDENILFRAGTGTVTNEDYSNAFRATPRVEFFSTYYDRRQLLEGMKKLGQLLGIQPEKMAILSEDETAFAQPPVPDVFGIRTIRFPREISSLRNAYGEAGESAQPGSSSGAGRLPMTLHDSDGGEDSAPLFARSYTPQAQYAAMGTIVQSLRGTKLTAIAATNVLDALFLAGVIHEGLPSTRIVVPEADLLFVRAAREQSLSGVLALTPYPLWMPSQRRHVVLPFVDSSAESVFNATLMLLHPNAERELRDYDNPFSAAARPPLWIAQESVSGYWPIDVIDFDRTAGGPRLFGSTVADFAMPAPPGVWWVLGLLLASAGIFAAVFALKANRREAQELQHFSISSRPQVAVWQLILLLGAALCMIGIAASLEGPVVVKFPESEGFYLAALMLFTAVSLAAVGYVWFRLTWKSPLAQATKTRLTWAAVLTVFIAATAALAVMATMPGARITLAAVRALQLTSGCSPAVPVILLLCGLGYGLLSHMRRLGLACERDPGIPIRGIPGSVPDRLRHHRNAVYRAIRRSWTLWKEVGWQGAVPLAAVAAVCLSLRPWESVVTTDGLGYSVALFVLAMLLVLGVAWTAAVFARVWKRLKALLREVDRLPLAGAFRRLPHQFTHVPIWQSAGREALNFTTFFRAVDCVSELRAELARERGVDRELVAEIKLRADALAHIRERVQILERRKVHVNRREVANCARECAEFLLERILVPQWNSGKTDPDPGPDGEKGAAEPVGRERSYRLAAEYVALRFASYIRYVVMQLRNLLLFASVGFVLLSLALSSLDFQSPEGIRWFLVAMFAAVGVPSVLVLLEMERDPVLSRMADSNPGELSGGVFLRLAGFGLLPLLGMLSNQFPSFSRFLFSWLQPTLANLK